MVAVWLMVVLGLGGCTTASYPMEREAAAYLIWSKRGHDLGLLIRTYCLTGSLQERAWMRSMYHTVASPAKVMIICPPPTE